MAKNDAITLRHKRIRKRVQGNEARPRLTVFRSVAHMYVQVVDDMTGRTIASASTVEPDVKGAMQKAERGGNIAGAKAIGKAIAERLIGKGVKRLDTVDKTTGA